MHLLHHECSLQRRHQKVVEEAPVCSISDELRGQPVGALRMLGEAARYLSRHGRVQAITQTPSSWRSDPAAGFLPTSGDGDVLGLDLVELQVRNGRRSPAE